MHILIDVVKIVLLFIVLGLSADLTVKNIKYLGTILKIRLFAFGILLGLITSLPELSLGINATINQATILSVGNLLGGIIVMLGLILGLSLILNRKIKTDGQLITLIPTILIIFSPIFLGIDGDFNLLDGLLMIGLYAAIIFYLYRQNHNSNEKHVEINNSNKVGRSIIMTIIGILGIVISSNWIVTTTIDLLSYVHISQLIIGLTVFSIGTTLPEISIAITSWRKKSSELSLSNLLGSSFANILILGLLAFVRPIKFETDPTYWIVAIFLTLILILFGYFYYSGKKMDRREGVILLAVYILFIIVNIFFGLFNT